MRNFQVKHLVHGFSDCSTHELWVNSYLPSPAPVHRCGGLLLLSPLLHHKVRRVLTQIMHHIWFMPTQTFPFQCLWHPHVCASPNVFCRFKKNIRKQKPEAGLHSFLGSFLEDEILDVFRQQQNSWRFLMMPEHNHIRSIPLCTERGSVQRKAWIAEYQNKT